jgi:hypothetical protein
VFHGQGSEREDLNPAIAAIGHIKVVSNYGDVRWIFEFAYTGAGLITQSFQRNKLAPLRIETPHAGKLVTKDEEHARLIARHPPRQNNSSQTAILAV